MPRTIGKVAALENAPTTITHFAFWTKQGEMLSPFDIVCVSHVESSITYGQVEEISHITDSASFMASFISNDFGEVETDIPTLRVGMNYIKARVLGNTKGIYIPVHNDAAVSLASQDQIEQALGFNDIKNRVICGTSKMYSSMGSKEARARPASATPEVLKTATR